jgi:hypothetical protein
MARDEPSRIGGTYSDFTAMSNSIRREARERSGLPEVSLHSGGDRNISQEDREAVGLSQSQAEWHQAALPGLTQPAPSPTHEMVSNRPLSKGGAVGHGGWQGVNEWSDRDVRKPVTNPTAEDWGAVGPSQSKKEWTHGSGTGAHHGVSGDQLKMFMTPREIQDTYQVLDADREERYDERAGEPTNREYTTAGELNTAIPTGIREGGTIGSEYEYQRHRWNYERNRYGSELQRATHLRTEESGYETDEDVWNRKLEESQLSPRDYGEVHGMSRTQEAGPPEMVEDLYHMGKIGSSTLNELIPTENPRYGEAGTGTWDRYHERLEAADEALAKGQAEWEDKYGDYAPSLYESVQQGGVQSPVHLGTRIGSQGKPEVAGGHHRIAAAANINSDQLIPVLHWQGGIREARFGQSAYKYT